MTRISLRIGTVLAVALSLAPSGCDGGPEHQPPSGPLAEALADVRGGTPHGALGVGWVEPQLVEESGAGAELIADALGPNAGTVIEAAPVLRRRFGFDPLAAERLISVGGSYAFGLRLDGVDGRRLGQALARAGGRVREIGQLELVYIGAYAVVPEPLLRAGVLGLGARDAFGRDLTVLAISETARAALLGRGHRPRLVALGVARKREVLCVLGGTAERADEVATALQTSLASDAREPDSGESMADIVSAVDVETAPYEGVEVVRAELSLDTGQPPGFRIAGESRRDDQRQLRPSPATTSPS